MLVWRQRPWHAFRMGLQARLPGAFAASFLALLCSVAVSSSHASAAARRDTAPGGCGTEAPTNIGPNGVFIGVIAKPRPDTNASQVLRSIPNDTVALWCVRVVFVQPAGHKGAGGARVQFLAKASSADVQRAAAYLRKTGFFRSVTVVPHPKHY